MGRKHKDFPREAGESGEVRKLKDTIRRLVSDNKKLIAENENLASLICFLFPIHYLELPGAPACFIPERASLNSQFFLWPHYAEATLLGSDPLYQEESYTSPFIGKNALYITFETVEDLPESIQDGFSSLSLMSTLLL